MQLVGKGPVREAQLEAKIIRADGTVEDLGIISYYHKNPIKRWRFALKQKVGS